SQGTYNSATGLWTVGTVSATAPQTLQIRAMVVSPNPRTNTAAVSHADQFDPDPGNNSAAATEPPQHAHLQVTKPPSNPPPNAAEPHPSPVPLPTAGPDAATNVTPQDTLPAGVPFAPAAASQGSYSAGTGVWTVGTVTPGGPQTLALTARVTDPVASANTA